MGTSIIIDLLNPVLTNFQFSIVSNNEEAKIRNKISQFETLKTYSMVVLSETICLRNNQSNSYLSLLSISNTYKNIKSPQLESSFTEQEIIGFATLKNDYGKVLIRPETIADKINELIYKLEIDFEFDKEFSRKYYVLTNNEEKLRKNISAEFLSITRKYKGLEIEIEGNSLLVRLKKQFTIETGEIIANFITEINNGKN